MNRWIVVAVGAALAVGCRTQNAEQSGTTGGAGAEVVFGTVSVKEGSVSANELTDKLSQLQPAMKGCYTNSLTKDPKAEGVIELHMKGDQAATDAQVTKSTVDTSLTQCVLQAVRSVKPDSGKTFEADWSVNFDLKGY